MHLYRAFPWRASAAVGERGHPLFVPTSQGAGRIDNPSLYRVLYTSDDPAGAIAEAIGRFSRWDGDMLDTFETFRGGALALARVRLDRSKILDLDEAAVLGKRGLRPSHVATRARDRTQAWARMIFDENRWRGIRWWGYYEAAWGSIGLWDVDGITVDDVEPLTLDHADLRRAAQTLGR